MDCEINIHVDDEEDTLNEDKENLIEFYYSKGMDCPIDECTKKDFTSKKNYWRHWNERHRESNVSYKCAIAFCPAECRRRGDMRVHIRNRHEPNPILTEDILSKCEIIKKDNKGFIDPGFFVFKGRSEEKRVQERQQEKRTVEKKEVNPPSTSERKEKRIVDRKTEQKEVSPPSTVVSESQNPTCYRTPMDKMEAISPNVSSCFMDTDYDIREEESNDNRNVTSAVAEVQTLCGGLPPMEVPPVPEDERELEMYLVYVCNAIDAACRARELAKQRLDSIRKEKKRSVSKWEEENRKLREEIKRLKEDHLEL